MYLASISALMRDSAAFQAPVGDLPSRGSSGRSEARTRNVGAGQCAPPSPTMQQVCMHSWSSCTYSSQQRLCELHATFGVLSCTQGPFASLIIDIGRILQTAGTACKRALQHITAMKSLAACQFAQP